MTSHCAGSELENRESKIGIRKREKVGFKIILGSSR